MNKEIEIPEGYEARIEGNKVILEPKKSDDGRIVDGLIEFLRCSFYVQDSDLDYEKIEKWIAYLEKQKAKEKYDRMAPIYSNQQSFEDALEKAWKFYNDSSSRTVDGLEDNSIELSFAKGFREGFLCKEKQKEQKLTECTSNLSLQKINRAITDCKKLSEHYKDVEENFHQYYGGKAEGLQLALIYFRNENKLAEQKLAEWSEEDEKMRQYIISDLLGLMDSETDEEYVSDYEDEIDWLKSLHP